MVNILDYGAVGDGKTLNTESFRQTVSEAARTNTSVAVPAGTFLTGTIDLQGAASLHLEKGAVIKASPDLKDYPEQDYYHNELGVLRALIVCLGGARISVLTGKASSI